MLNIKYIKIALLHKNGFKIVLRMNYIGMIIKMHTWVCHHHFVSHFLFIPKIIKLRKTEVS